METCLLIRRWTVQRWRELNAGVYTERGNPRADVKGEYQVEELQGKSTDAVMGADLVVVVKKYL